MIKNRSPKHPTMVAVAILTLSYGCILAQCKPVDQTNKRDLKDPMLALPSEAQTRYIGLDQRQQAELQTVQYFVNSHLADQTTQSQPIMESIPYEAHANPTTVDQSASGPRDEEQELRTYIQLPNHQHEGADCRHKPEYMSIISLPSVQNQASGQEKADVGHEYSAEILYVGNNQAASRPMIQEITGNQANSELTNVASMISKSSGLPATILTEVPVKDMPQDVLEKLKKDYGVKVVATRNRPGASLVINCDDYPGQEGTMCGTKQPLYTAQNMPYYFGPTQRTTIEHDAEPHVAGEIESVDRYSAYNAEHPDPPTGMYVTRNGDTRIAGKTDSSHEEHESKDNLEGYGARNQAPNEQTNSNAHDNGEDEQHGQDGETHTDGPIQTQPEGEQQDSGFESPANVGGETKQ